MTARLAHVLPGIVAGFACGAAAAAEWTTVSEASTVTMYATKQGAWINGTFEKFAATIHFDPAQPEAGRIVGVVHTASIDTQDSQNDTYVRAYLNAEEFPEARFESTNIVRTAEGYRATGELDLAGHRNPAVLDFAFVAESDSASPAGTARFYATMLINRFDYDIASDIDVNSAGQDVTVQVELSLRH